MDSLTQTLASNPSFTPLFRLLDDFERYSRRLGIDTRHHHRDRVFRPRFDLRELPASFELHGEVPGVKKEDLTVEFTGARTLVVRGSVSHSYEGPAVEGEQGQLEPAPDKTPETQGNGVRWWVSERGVGSFSRSFDLPIDVDQAGVSAKLDGGVLRVTVPKASKELEKTRRVTIA